MAEEEAQDEGGGNKLDPVNPGGKRPGDDGDPSKKMPGDQGGFNPYKDQGGDPSKVSGVITEPKGDTKGPVENKKGGDKGGGADKSGPGSKGGSGDKGGGGGAAGAAGAAMGAAGGAKGGDGGAIGGKTGGAGGATDSADKKEAKTEAKEAKTEAKDEGEAGALLLLSPEGAIMMLIAVFLDAIGIVLNLLFDLNVITDTLGTGIFGAWIYIRSGSKAGFKKSKSGAGPKTGDEVLKNGLKGVGKTLAIKIIPFVGSLFSFWTYRVYKELTA